MPLPGGGSGGGGLPKKKQPDSIEVNFPDAETVPAGDRDADLPLENTVGGPLRSGGGSFFVGGADILLPEPTVYNRDKQAVAGSPSPSDPLLLRRNVLPNYATKPTPIELQERQATRAMDIIMGQGVSPWDEAAIKDQLHIMVDMPQAALFTDGFDENRAIQALTNPQAFTSVIDEDGNYRGLEALDEDERARAQSSAKWILENPDFIDRWQSSAMGHMLASQTALPEGYTTVGTGEEQAREVSAEFFKKFEATIPPNIKEFIVSNMAMFPDPGKILAESEYTPSGDPSGWAVGPTALATFFLGDSITTDIRDYVKAATRAPEAIRGSVQNPLYTWLAEANIWLEENAPSTDAEWGQFLDFLVMRRNMAIEEVQATTSGVTAGLNALLLPTGYVPVSSTIADWMGRGGNPDSYFDRSQMTLGQQLALGSGYTPDSEHWTTVSGGWDGLAQLTPLDPINAFVGIGAGIKNASRIPRLASKAETITDVLKFNRAGALANLPIFDSGPISSFSYAVFSKSIDDMVDGRGFSRLARWIANTGSESEIINRIPEWAQVDNRVIEYLAVADDEQLVKEIVRNALVAPEAVLGETSPLWFAKTAEDMKAAIPEFKANVQAWLDEGGSIGGLRGVPAENIVINVEKTFDEGVTQRMSRVGPRLADSPVVSPQQTVYHASIDAEALRAGGWNEGLAGGGLAHPDAISSYVSTVGEAYEAERVADTLRAGARLAQPDATVDDALDSIERILSQYDDLSVDPENIARWMGLEDEVTEWDELADLVGDRPPIEIFNDALYGATDDFQGVMHLQGDLSRFRDLDPDKIGVVEARVKPGASPARTDDFGELQFNPSDLSFSGNVTVRKAGNTYSAFVDGEWAGAAEQVMSTNPNIAVTETMRGRGVGRAMLNAMSDDEIRNLANADSITGSARGLLKSVIEERGLDITVKPAAVADGPIYRMSSVTGDGSTKGIIMNHGGRQKIGAIDPYDAANFLDEVGLSDDAAILVQGGSISELSARAQSLMPDYLRAKGLTVGGLNDEVVLTPRARDSLVTGADATAPADDVPGFLNDRWDDYAKYDGASRRYFELRDQRSPHKWFIADIGTPMNRWTRTLRTKLATDGKGRFSQGLRRAGFRMTNRYPTNIDMTDTFNGGRQLRRWMKLMGATDEMANKWEDAFRRGNVGNRHRIIQDAFSEVGEEIDNPMLRDRLLQWREKGNDYNVFSTDRNGNPLMQRRDGTVKPATVSHLATTFAMPDAKVVASSLKRYRQTRWLPAKVQRGFGQTKQTRELLQSQLKNRLRDMGIRDVDPDDLLSMAYADVLGGEYGRAAGYGVITRSMKAIGRGYNKIHNTFVLAQLAGRPIAWSSRVLLEEQLRAGMMGLPALWKNPYDYAWQMWESQSIRNLPEVLQKQGYAVDTMVAKMFDNFNLDDIKEVLPDIELRASQARVPIGDTPKFRDLVSYEMQRDLLGSQPETLGGVANITNRSVRRRRDRLQRIYRRMERDGLADTFRWDVDGADIAQRSVWSNWMLEAESASEPMLYTLGSRMSQRALNTYGRGYGRQMFQMVQDPIVGPYGFGRALDSAAGKATEWTGEKLVKTQAWTTIRHIVNEHLDDVNPGIVGEVARANWYLDNVVDEIVDSLFTPLAQGDRAERTRILTELRRGKRTKVNIGGTEFTLNAAADNYEGFVREVANLAPTAHAADVALPPQIAGYVDPRFGQRTQEVTTMQRAREAADWIMDYAGERPSQYLHRQPAFKHIHGKWYRYLRDAGWAEEPARIAASQRAAELTNFIFFDNKNIPAFLKDMNRYVPFFSAMFEVGSTWIYKIPSVDILPVGYMHLARRVERTLRALRMSGLVDVDPETNQMTFTVSEDMPGATSSLSETVGRTFYRMMSAPNELFDMIPGLDTAAWDKDGLSITIGNPLDPTSSGLMAVNQFAIGATPIVSFPAGIAANAIFAMNDEHISTGGVTVGEFLESNDDYTIEEILRFNEQAFVEANTEELFQRALDGDWDMETMKMPDTIVLPHTSFAETMANSIFFPFGKLHTQKGALNFLTPSYLDHMWRGLFAKFGVDDSEITSYLIGSTSQAAIGGELINQLQMVEATSGKLSKVLDLTDASMRLLEEAGLELAEGDGRAILNPEDNQSVANQVQEMWRDADALADEALREATNNAAGSMFMRGIMGALGPSTPRMWDREQEQIGTYWAARSIAEEARETGRVDWSQAQNINSAADMTRLRRLVAAFLDDKSGDAAKAEIRSNYPSLMPYTLGRTYWDGAGPPVYADGFDEWNEQMASGDRKVFPPEVWFMRYLRAGLSIDRELAIHEHYGTDPYVAAQKILQNPAQYREVTEDFDARFDAVDFLDVHMFDGRYDAWRTDDLDELSAYEVLEERHRVMRQNQAELSDMIRNDQSLSPEDRQNAIGTLWGVTQATDDALAELQQFKADNSTYRNPRELLIEQYFEEVSDPYGAAITEALLELPNAESQEEISRVWENVRNITDKAYKQSYVLEAPDGRKVQVPDPVTRSWNNRTQREQQERLLALVAKRPEWLSALEVDVIAQETPAAFEFFPTDDETRQMYAAATAEKNRIYNEWVADPDSITPSKRDSLMRDVDDQVDEWLMQNGREKQVEFKNATPMKKLHLLGVLPVSLSGMMPVLNEVYADLDSIGKSPRTNAGETALEKFAQWMVSDYFRANPQARDDYLRIGQAMYGETAIRVVNARLLRGERFGG